MWALWGVACITLVGSLLMIYSVLWGPLHSLSASWSPARTISISASGKATVVPDIATVSFSVVTEGADVATITTDNNKKITSAIAEIKKAGIEAKDIKTTQYSLNPVYTQRPSDIYPYTSSAFVSRIGGYSLTQSVTVKIRDFSLIPSLLSLLPQLGVNDIGSIQFTIDDQEKYLAQARDDAFAKARAKAENMAHANKFSLGKVVTVSEYSNQSYYPTMSAGFGGKMESTDIAAPTIEPGSSDVSVNVNVVYEIR